MGWGVRVWVRPHLLRRVLHSRDAFGAWGACRNVPALPTDTVQPSLVRLYVAVLPKPASFESLVIQKYLLDFILIAFASELYRYRDKDNKELLVYNYEYAE